VRKDLRKTIFETVSTVRNLFHKMKEMLDEESRQNKHLETRLPRWTNNLTIVEARTLRDKQIHLTSESRNYQEPIADSGCHLTAVIGSFTPA
jgi:hypothetical protein